MYGRAEKKIAKKVKKQAEYQAYFRSKAKNSKPSKDTWTSAQWQSADETGKQMAKAGVMHRTYRKMKGK